MMPAQLRFHLTTGREHQRNSPMNANTVPGNFMRKLGIFSLLVVAWSGAIHSQTLVLEIDSDRSDLEWEALVLFDGRADLLRAPLEVGGRLSVTSSDQGFRVEKVGVSLTGSGSGYVEGNTIEVDGALLATIAATRRRPANGDFFKLALEDDYQLTLSGASITRRAGDSEVVLDDASFVFQEQKTNTRLFVNLHRNEFQWWIEAEADLEFDGRIENTEIRGVVRGDARLISEEFPFESQFVDVLGSRMRYVDEGAGESTFLLLHGNPTSTYLWRNVIDHLTPKGRVVALDLIGFGESAKPEIDYTFLDHSAYVDTFIEALELEDVILVVHDWGGAVGINYAARHPDNVVGLVFFETFLGPFESLEQAFGPSSGDPTNPSLFDLFSIMRSGVVNDPSPASGWELNVRQNFFVEGLVPAAILRPLTENERDQYRAPFIEESSRLPVWRLPREIPIGGVSVGGSAAVAEALESNVEYLTTSPIPKLNLYATPGILIQEARDLPLIRSFPNVKAVPFGAGLHYLQEDNPHRIGLEIVEWFDENF